MRFSRRVFSHIMHLELVGVVSLLIFHLLFMVEIEPTQSASWLAQEAYDRGAVAVSGSESR